MATTPIRNSQVPIRNKRHAWRKSWWKGKDDFDARWRAFLGKWFCDKYPELV